MKQENYKFIVKKEYSLDNKTQDILGFSIHNLGDSTVLIDDVQEVEPGATSVLNGNTIPFSNEHFKMEFLQDGENNKILVSVNRLIKCS